MPPPICTAAGPPDHRCSPATSPNYATDYLWDLGHDDELPWRRVGQAWEPPPPAAGEGGAEGAEVLSLADLAADIETQERYV